MTWWIIAFDGVTGDVTFIDQIYKGYRVTPLGSVIGMPAAQGLQIVIEKEFACTN